jgi:hypothetical protein
LSQLPKRVRITLALVAKPEVEADNGGYNLQRQQHHRDKVHRADPGEFFIKCNNIYNINTHPGKQLLLVPGRCQIPLIVAFAHNILGMGMKGHDSCGYACLAGKSYSRCYDAGMSTVQSIELTQGNYLRLRPLCCRLRQHRIA